LQGIGLIAHTLGDTQKPTNRLDKYDLDGTLGSKIQEDGVDPKEIFKTDLGSVRVRRIVAQLGGGSDIEFSGGDILEILATEDGSKVHGTFSPIQDLLPAKPPERLPAAIRVLRLR